MYHSTACEFNIYQSTFLRGASGVAIHQTIKACFKEFWTLKVLKRPRWICQKAKSWADTPKGPAAKSRGGGRFLQGWTGKFFFSRWDWGILTKWKSWNIFFTSGWILEEVPRAVKCGIWNVGPKTTSVGQLQFRWCERVRMEADDIVCNFCVHVTGKYKI